MKFAKLLISVSIVIAAHSSAIENKEFRKRANDKDFECSWVNKPFTVDFEGELIHIGKAECKFLAKLSTTKSGTAPINKSFIVGCTADKADAPAPTPEACDKKNDRTEPTVFSATGYVVDKKELKANESAELAADVAAGKKKYGECVYSVSPNAIGTGLQYKEGFAYACSSPVTCTGGKVAAPSIAICPVAAPAKVVPEWNPDIEKMEDVSRPVCPPAEACLVRMDRQDKIKVLNVQVGFPQGFLNAKSRENSRYADQFASTTDPKSPLLHFSGSRSHIVQ